MIVIEGMDNTGKTTLKENLLKFFPDLKFGGKSPGPIDGDSLHRWMMGFLTKPRSKTGPLVFDRFPYFSEQVYGSVLRGKVDLTSRQMSDIHTRLVYHKPLIIYCQLSLPHILGNFDEREQMEGVREHTPEIILAYEGMWKRLRGSFKVIRYNYKLHNEPIITVDQYITEMRRMR